MNVSMGHSPAPLAYTVPDACKASGLGRTTLYELMGEGHIRAMKAGARTLICAESLRRYLASLPPLQPKKAA